MASCCLAPRLVACARRSSSSRLDRHADRLGGNSLNSRSAPRVSPGPARLLPVSSSAGRDGGGAGSGEDEQDGSSQSGRRPMYFPPAGTIDPPSWLSWLFYPAAIQQIVHSRTHSSTDPAGPLSPLELADLVVRRFGRIDPAKQCGLVGDVATGTRNMENGMDVCFKR